MRIPTRKSRGLQRCLCLGSLALATFTGQTSWAQSPTAGAASTAPPIEDFFRLPQYFGGELSPDGQWLAVIASPEGRRTQLIVVNLRDLKSARALVTMDDSDIHQVHWVNNKRLVFDIAQLQEATDKPNARGLWAVDRDGGDFRQLVNARSSVPNTNMEGGSRLANSRLKERSETLLPWTWRLQDVVRDGSADVILRQNNYDGNGEFSSASLARLNTYSAQKQQLVEDAPAHVHHWLTDSAGKAVGAITQEKDKIALYLARKEGSGWQLWRRAPRVEEGIPRWLDIASTGEIFMVGAGNSPGAGEALLLLDPKKPQQELQELLRIKDYDFRGELVLDEKSGRLLGAHFEAETQDSVWLDPAMKALQAEVDQAMRSTVNQILCRDCLNSDLVVVKSHSDRQPMAFSIYDRQNKSLKTILLSRPWIKPGAMAARENVRIPARDGLMLPTLVTRPKSSQPLPTVVLVHGGPFSRGNHWEWSAIPQYLASRGYLVIETDFRGSEGYGSSFERAGWKQWGTGMVDDVVDATRWAVAKGYADAARICIAGGSYGGYASMMALIRYPETFKCGINWVGVSDLSLLYTSLNSDQGALGLSYDMPIMVGDPKADGEMLKQNSPLQQAARLKQPLLMAYGAIDRRVPMEHGVKMRDALQASGNKQVEWVLYPEEGHGWRGPETHKDFWGRVERFLGRHLAAQ